MTFLLRLDLERIRRNLEAATGQPHGDEDVLRELAARGVWRHNEEWWGATQEAAERFAAGELLERRAKGQQP